MEIIVPSTLNVVTGIVCLSLGTMVLVRNPRRTTNRVFAVLAFNLMLWALCVFMVLQSRTRESILFWIHAAEFVVCFIPATFYHFIGYFPRGQFDGNRRFLYLVWAVGVALAFNSLGPWYLGELTLVPGKPPLVDHSPTLLFVIGTIVTTFLVIHANLRRKLREMQGFARLQTQFVITGVYGIAGIATTVAILEPIFQIQTFQAYTPLCVVLLMGSFAYAMIRYHLLDTRALVAKFLVFCGSTLFVIATFVIFMGIVQLLVGSSADAIQILPALFTGLIVTLVFQTVKDRVETFIEVNLLGQRYDIDRLYRRIAGQAAEVVQLDDLLRGVAKDIQETIGVRTIRVLLLAPEDPSVLATEFTTVENDPIVYTREHRTLLDYLRENPIPLILEKILHRRPSERMVRIARHLADLDAYFCLPLLTGDGVVGILTLGPKDTHDIYSNEEMLAFHALSGPLGTAIANARLYRELEHVHMHQSNVFGQMREGVIAVDTLGKVTTTNEAAVQLNGPVREGDHLDDLTPEVADLLARTLELEAPVSDFEATLHGAIPVVMSSSCLQTHEGETTGAVALIYDLSQVKRLEQNVQRADRLSSIGTLAAGMAHEIKNPLVSIKTFSQLLLKKHTDPEFRSTFSDIVPHEVDRIDTIVSRLLDFARPRPVRFEPQNLLEVIEEVLALVDNQTRKSDIRVILDFPPGELMVKGDEQQLHQIFLNLALNAIDAMKDEPDGLLTISARCNGVQHRQSGTPMLLESSTVLVAVSDNGCGIPHQNLQELFTPFFTTKDEGCGLGLAVVHGIVTEHGGEIDVTSSEGHGTTFFVSLPTTQEAYSANAN